MNETPLFSRTTTTSGVIASLDAALADHLAKDDVSRCALAFDADGTIWSGDVGTDAFEALLAARDVRVEAKAALAAEAATYGEAVIDDVNELAAALYRAFESQRYDEARAFAMMAWAFAGRREDEMRDFAETLVRRVDLAARVRPSSRAFLAWAKARGVAVYVVSASPRAIVQAGVAKLGVAADRVCAMQPEVENGVLVPKLHGHVIYGAGKVEALRERAGDVHILGAFGDSAYDAPMLDLAAVPVAICPSQGLRTLLHAEPRKSHVHVLEARDAEEAAR